MLACAPAARTRRPATVGPSLRWRCPALGTMLRAFVLHRHPARRHGGLGAAAAAAAAAASLALTANGTGRRRCRCDDGGGSVDDSQYLSRLHSSMAGARDLPDAMARLRPHAAALRERWRETSASWKAVPARAWPARQPSEEELPALRSAANALCGNCNNVPGMPLPEAEQGGGAARLRRHHAAVAAAVPARNSSWQRRWSSRGWTHTRA
eukprot:COSAG01_NODE_21916_length_879_cov_1.987179_1_plen_210_part_00